MQDSYERARARYPQIPDLDLHYYGLKGHGIRDEKIHEGRPKFHLIDDAKLFSVVPLISSQHSPYVFEDEVLTYKGQELPFRVKHIGRVGRNPAYFYYRGIQEWMPTLDAETILSLNFQPVCKGCDWCCRKTYKGMRNIPLEQGINILQEAGVDLTRVDKITFVTGMYRNEEEVADNILRTVDLAKRLGFDGRVLYIGAQIKEPSSIRELIRGLDGTPLKYAYTVETFTKREKMHIKKNGSLEGILSILEGIKKAGLEDLEYSYIPGLDPMDTFHEWMPRFSGLARPHLSIFRPTEEDQEELKDIQFLEDPVGYLCLMRFAFEKEHGGPVYQNNLASLWGFPKDRINPLFLTERTSLE